MDLNLHQLPFERKRQSQNTTHQHPNKDQTIFLHIPSSHPFIFHQTASTSPSILTPQTLSTFSAISHPKSIPSHSQTDNDRQLNYKHLSTTIYNSMIETGTNFHPKRGHAAKENHRQPQSPELAELEEGNRRIAADNSALLHRIKNKWKTNMQLKRRLKQLQSLTAEAKPAGATDDGRRIELRKHRSVEGFDARKEAEEIEALEERFNALVVQNMEKKGISRVKIRAEMSQLAKKIRDMKSVKVSLKM